MLDSEYLVISYRKTASEGQKKSKYNKNKKQRGTRQLLEVIDMPITLIVEMAAQVYACPNSNCIH